MALTLTPNTRKWLYDILVYGAAAIIISLMTMAVWQDANAFDPRFGNWQAPVERSDMRGFGMNSTNANTGVSSKRRGSKSSQQKSWWGGGSGSSSNTKLAQTKKGSSGRPRRSGNSASTGNFNAWAHQGQGGGGSGAVGGVKHGCLPAVVKGELAYISRTYGRVTVVSAHRPGAKVAGTGKTSYHASCRAADFHVKGNQAAAAAYLSANWPGGFGTYSGNMHHLHIDNGPRARWHTCVGCGGGSKSKRKRKK